MSSVLFWDFTKHRKVFC